MPVREQSLAEFVDALHAAALAGTADSKIETACDAAIDKAFGALAKQGSATPAAPVRLDACRHATPALTNARRETKPLAHLAEAFEALAPSLHWYLRPPQADEEPRFRDGHANAYVIGLNGLEKHDDIAVGVSLMAPGVTYPNHSHPPEEIYVVMSGGDWFNEDDGWYTPGPGNLVYHRPGIVHAMRSGDEPLLAIWCLWRP